MAGPNLTEVVTSPEANQNLNTFIGSSIEVIGILGLFGTLLLITTVIRFKYTKSEAGFIIILSLAVADGGHLTVILGHVGPELLTNEISWGWAVEGLFSHGNLLFWYASLANYCLMAVNRYYAVCKPMSVAIVFGNSRTWKYVSCAWIMAFVLSLTPFTGMCCRKVFDIHHDEEDEEAISDWKNYLKIITLLLNVVTVIVMCACYTAVVKKLRKTINSVKPQGRISRQMQREIQKEKRGRRICYQFLIISLVFTLLLGFQLATQIGWKHKSVISVLQMLYTLNSSINPVIYLGFNRKLRFEMWITLLCKGSEHLRMHSGTFTGGRGVVRGGRRSEPDKNLREQRF